MKHFKSFNRQSAAVLVISLFMLLLLTLIGISGTQVTTLEEKMANNSREKNIAFQAAESALRDGEGWIASLAVRPLKSNSPNSAEVWEMDAPATDASVEDWWDEGIHHSTWWSNNAVQSASALNKVATNPYYLIEQQEFSRDSLTVGMTSDNHGRLIYRVTAKGSGGTDVTEVLLQSTYSKRF